MLVVWKERGICRDSYWMEANDPDFGGKYDDHFGDLTTNLEAKCSRNTRIITLSLLETELWRFFWNIPCDVAPCRKTINIGGAQTREGSLWSFVCSVSW
ncbi:hypothetical protein AVEN_136351-1 [Araneus ventricosus]|uniref:Uncharacterized protein n=1 Tax=Araneus ventricosus TaxID=182803 RepID=A0A4Y2E1C1_ARAVE|nr:hypothetical protein AVEN_136351-1 [Araneus ventricosus]